MEKREFSGGKIRELQAREEFDYYDLNHQDSWLDSLVDFIKQVFAAFANWISQQVGWTVNPFIFEVIFYGIMVIGLAFFILKMIGVDVRGSFFFKSKKVEAAPYQLDEQDIHEMDFEQLIAEAKNENNNLLIIRYRYLQILKLLTDKKLIHYELRKTNAEYQNELRQHAASSDYRHLALCFEKVWYGRIEPDLALSQTAESHSEKIKSLLNE